jgi:hypothetical protein
MALLVNSAGVHGTAVQKGTNEAMDRERSKKAGL